MVTDLRVAGRRTFQGADLKDLGKVNLVCGPNNSGKTTILEAIVLGTGTEPLYRIDDQIIESAIAKALPAADWNHGSRYPSADLAFRQVVSNVFSPLRLVARSEAPEISSQIRTLAQHNRDLREWNTPATNVLNLLFDALPTYSRKSYIPAKRLVENTCKINPSEEFENDGRGLLNDLFRLSTGRTGSPRRTLYDNVQDAFKSITNGYDFFIDYSKNGTLDLSFALGAGERIAASDCGLGMRELLALIRGVLDPDMDILCIEEPENHLHPELQRRLLQFISDTENKTFFLASHSSVFVQTSYTDRVFTTTSEGAIEVKDSTARAEALYSLGYSVTENLNADMVILVEGPGDRLIIDALLSQSQISRMYSVKIWPLGGDIMDQHDLSIFGPNHKVVALIDGDPKSSQVRGRFKALCKDSGIHCHQLKGYSIENYIPTEVYRAQFPNDDVPEVLSLTEKVEVQLRFDPKRQIARMAQKIRLEDVASTELGQFIRYIDEQLVKVIGAR